MFLRRWSIDGCVEPWASSELSSCAERLRLVGILASFLRATSTSRCAVATDAARCDLVGYEDSEFNDLVELGLGERVSLQKLANLEEKGTVKKAEKIWLQGC